MLDAGINFEIPDIRVKNLICSSSRKLYVFFIIKFLVANLYI